ncbi:MAG: hypothetical protein KC933_29460 [Myxococcales bacterium]|nr:hypothetical protein [Myxococcales bacterium]
MHHDSEAPFHLSGHTCSRIGAERLGDGAGYFMRVECLDDGRFEVEGLPPGRYRLKDRASWMNSPVQVHEVEVEVGPEQIVEDVRLPITGEESDTWRFRVLNERGGFVPGLYLRVHDEQTSFTSGMALDDKGTAEVNVNRKYRTVFIDAPGYASAKVELAGRDPKQLIELRMTRLDPGK